MMLCRYIVFALVPPKKETTNFIQANERYSQATQSSYSRKSIPHSNIQYKREIIRSIASSGNKFASETKSKQSDKAWNTNIISTLYIQLNYQQTVALGQQTVQQEQVTFRQSADKVNEKPLGIEACSGQKILSTLPVRSLLSITMMKRLDNVPSCNGIEPVNLL